MPVPETLVARTYLLACDQRGQRTRGGARLGYTLRAAALTDLLLEGRIVDAGRKAKAGEPTESPDPVLGQVLRQVTESRPRSWQHWIRKDGRKIVRSVRDQLAEQGTIRVEHRTVLGFIPVHKVRVRDTRDANRLARLVTGVIGGSQPLSRLDPYDGALAALAAAGELGTVLSRAQRRQNRKRIRLVEEFTGPVARALRKTIQNQRAAASGGGG